MKSKKIVSEKALFGIIQEFKKQGKVIVTCNGSFDILHSGHLFAISEAKRQGDVLIILLNSDESIRKYKGPTRPIVSQEERSVMLSALEDVDHVAIFNDINPKRILEKIKPDIHCIGSEWGKNCVERAVVEQNGGKIHILKQIQGFSTSDLIKRIFRASSLGTVKAVFFDRDGVINKNRSGYTYKVENFEFTLGILPLLKKLSKTKFKIIIVTNQSGIGQGYSTLEDFQKLNRWMLAQLENKGIRIDKIYFYPLDHLI